MKNTRAVRLTALAAGALVVLAACSTPGQAPTSPTTSSTDSISSPDTAASGGGGSDTSSASSGSAGESAGPGASGSSAGPSSGGNAATGDNGCGTPHGSFADPGKSAGIITTGSAELASSWNNQTSHGNSVYNTNPQFLTQASVWYYDKDLKVMNNDQFITCKITKKDPLTIEYTINDAAKWSDGVPVTADDILLYWISGSGKFNTGEVKTDKDGNPLPSTGANVAFDTAQPGMALITDFPQLDPNGKKITLVLSKPFVDYTLNLPQTLVPAHVVGMKALGSADAKAANQAIYDAAKKDDKASLAKVANFWNTGFDFQQLPTDKSLYLSSGAYLLTKFVKDQYMTFTANPDYTWGPKPTINQITYQFLPDPTAAVQAMQNGEVQVIEPEHPTADTLKGLTALKGQGITTQTSVSGVYEHVDLVFDNKGPFDPATYGGDAAKANDVRQAFLKTIPRQDIVDRLVKPINPEGVVRDSFTQVPGSPGYDAIAKSNGMSAFDKPDIAGAKALLAKAGAKTPVSVRMLYSATSKLRAQEYQLMANSAKDAGFTVVDGKDPNWSSNLPNTAKYDASLFGWSNTNLGIAQVPPNYLGKEGGKWTGANNFGHYNNDTVNKIMDELNVTSDESKQATILAELEKNLVTDGFGTILYQYPDIVGFDSTKVSNVSSIPTSPNVFFNFWEWKLAG